MVTTCPGLGGEHFLPRCTPYHTHLPYLPLHRAAPGRFDHHPRPDDDRITLTWFANDQAGFQCVVPDALVALGWDGGPWTDRADNLASMDGFAKRGLTLASLEFSRGVFQYDNDVVILYSTFRVVLVDGDGTLQETTGQ